MSNTKRGLKALGLSLMAAMGLMAFTAAGAQAITWDVAGAEIKSDLLIGGALKETGKLLLPGLNIEVRCTTLDVEKDSRIRVVNDGVALLQFLGCTTHLISTGVVQPACVPTVLLTTGKVVPFLHNGVVKLLALPETGQTRFAQLDFPGGCALTETNNVTGSVVFECLAAKNGALLSCAHKKISQLIKPVSHATQLSLYPTDILKFGNQVALLDGEAEVFLTEGQVGKEFNALI